MAKCICKKFDTDGRVISVSTTAPKKPCSRDLLAAEIAAGRITHALCLATPWQAEERLAVVDGRPGFDLGEDGFLPLSERQAKEVLKGGGAK